MRSRCPTYHDVGFPSVGHIHAARWSKKYWGWKIDRRFGWSTKIRAIIGSDNHLFYFSSKLLVIHDAALHSWLQQDAVRRVMNNFPPNHHPHDGYLTIDSLLMSTWQTKTIATGVAQVIVDMLCRDYPDLWAQTTGV